MTPHTLTQLSYVLLGFAICAVWLPSISIGRGRCFPPWVALFVAAIIAGLISDVLHAPASLWLAALSAAAWSSQRVANRAWSILLTSVSALIALALALHVLPGFHNTLWISNARFTPNAAPFTQYLNFDKGAAGLILLAAYAPRCTDWNEWRTTIHRSVGVMLLTVFAVLGLATLTSYVRPELKLPAISLSFLASNLLFTCVAEEVFFRGLLQERLSEAFERHVSPRWALWIPVIVSAAMFGLAHAHGGSRLVLLSIVAGLGYSIAYARTRHIEAAVLTHFFVNAVHFIGFTYPYLM